MVTKPLPRLDEAQTPPSPMDMVRSLLTDCEAAITQHNGYAFDLAIDAAVDALLGMQERFAKQAGMWSPAADSQSGSVLAAELPELPPSLVAMHKAGVLRIKHEDKRDNG